MQFERIEVECYSGYKANERPLAFTHRGTRYLVQDIIDRWYEGGRAPGSPETSYFKVNTPDGVFIIRYQSLFDSWSIRI